MTDDIYKRHKVLASGLVSRIDNRALKLKQLVAILEIKSIAYSETLQYRQYCEICDMYLHATHYHNRTHFPICTHCLLDDIVVRWH